MIPALLKGKLTEEQQNLEDLLTSAVFGLLQYVPAETGILKLLALGVPFDEKSEIVLPQTVSSQSYDFWPWLQCNDCHGAEPDVLITLIDHTGTTHRVLIEAKFRSGKSSYADSASAIPTDQLAREWDNLVCMCKPKGWVPHMVYITADFGIPLKDIESAAEEFQAKRPEAASKYPLNCYWLSWRHIPAAYGKSSDPMLKDIRVPPASLHEIDRRHW